VKWISVKDRLPDNSPHKLLIIDNHRDIMIGWWYLQEDIPGLQGGWMFNEENISHWMNLPEAP